MTRLFISTRLKVNQGGLNSTAKIFQPATVSAPLPLPWFMLMNCFVWAM